MSDNWLQRRPNGQAALRLFCFPSSGAGASLFQIWQRHVPREIEVVGIQLPGREIRFNEEPYVDMLSLARKLVEVLSPYMDLPFAFYGHSMGSILSFEIVRELRRRGLPGPTHLFVGAYRAPQIPRDEKQIHRLGDKEMLAEVSRRYQSLPDEILESSELAELFLVPLRADVTMLETWRFTEDTPLDCPLTVFGGLQDGSVTRDQLLAWREHTTSEFNLSMLPGGHLFVRESYQLLLKAITNILAPSVPSCTAIS